MRTYTTDLINGKQVDNFIEWFDNAIGTETEISEYDDKMFSVTFFELTGNEVSKCRYFENNKLGQVD